MSFLNPGLLWFLLLVPLIVLFYILRAQYERVVIPSTLLWRNVVRDTEGRPSWRKPIRNLLLLLQLLVAILGALALARPATIGDSARHLILILDASTSMQANDVAPSRFEEAKRQAADLIRGAKDGDTFTIIRMGSSTDVVDAGENRTQLLQSLSSVQPGVAGGDVRAALQVAGSMAREKQGYRPEVVLFSDGAFDELPPLEDGIAELRVQTIGSSSDNQAVVQVRVRRSLDGSNRYEGFARLQNYSAAAVQVPVHALADGVQVDNRQVRIPARGTSDLLVPLNQSVKLFEVNIDRQDALLLDNYAQVVVPNEDVDVTLVSGSSQFLERALKAVPNVKLSVVRPQQYKRDSAGAMTIFDGFLPKNADQLPAGSVLVVNPPVGTASGMDVTELKTAQQIVRVNPRSALLDSVDLAGVFIPKAVSVKAPSGLSPTVESREAPLVWEGVDEGRKTVIIAFDPRQPEIGQRLAFPLMLANAVSWLAPNAGSPTLSPGQTINLQPARDAKDVVVRDPGGKSYVFAINATNKGKAIPFVQTEAVGRYAVLNRGNDNGTLLQSWFTVNAGEETHSDIRPKAFPVQQATNAMTGIANAINRELWGVLAAIGLGALSLEWLFYVRH